MGKKTNNTKTETPTKRAIKSKPAAEKAPPARLAVEPSPPESKPPAGKETPPKPGVAKAKGSTRAAKPAASRTKTPAVSQSDIALRAYYIAERRQAAGIHADPHQDWIEAERQLSYEAGKAVPRRAKKS